MASTLRLPSDLEERLGDYCASVGAAKSRVVVLALRSYLGEEGAPALPVARPFVEPETEPAPDQPRAAV